MSDVQALHDRPTHPQAEARGRTHRPPPAGSAAETATARQIVARLDAMPPAEARYLACFAYVMSRAAQADLNDQRGGDRADGAVRRRVRRARRGAGGARRSG